jgi:streptogramin lyase
VASIETHVGGGTVGRVVEATPAHDVKLKHPSGVSVTASGSVLVADSNAEAIRLVTRDGIVTTIAGGNGIGLTGDGGPAIDATFSKPTMAVEATDGSIFIADRDNDAIRVIGPDGTIATYAGGRAGGYDGDDGAAAAARISRPRALALDGLGGVWFTDRDNNAVRVIDADGTIRRVAGGHRGYSGDGGDARDAALWRPRGLGFDARGHLFIADRNNHAIREVDLDGRITTFAGGNGQGYSGDGGHCRDAQFDHVSGIEFDTDGVAYVTDHLNDAVRRIDPDGRIDTVVGGNGPGHSGDGGPARDAQLSYPSGLAIGDDGTLYLADRNNDLTRVVTGLCAPRLAPPSVVPVLAPRTRSAPASFTQRLARRLRGR